MPLAIALLIAAATLAFLWGFGSHSADLMASWVAGHYLHIGQPQHVYIGGDDLFTLHPDPAWAGMLAEAGYTGPVFPFIYPPIWAWLMGLLPSIEAFWVFSVAATLTNTLLLAATILLAYRASGTRMPVVGFVALAILLLGGTHVGSIALLQGQPQILVSFLLVLMIERLRAGDQTTAGIVLAVAAAIKIFPALFAIFWLFTGERRALAWFTIVGGALGLTSIAVTGWQLHMAFLHELSTISRTILVTGMSFNLHASFAQIFGAADLVRVVPIEVGRTPEPDAAWYYLEASAAAQWAARLALIATLALCVRLVTQANAADRAALVWPLVLTITALTAPLSWAYYYIPAFVFLPALVYRLGLHWGGLALLLGIGPIFGPIVKYYKQIELLAVPYQLVATVAMCVIVIAFFSVLRRQPTVQPTAMHPA